MTIKEGRVVALERTGDRGAYAVTTDGLDLVERLAAEGHSNTGIAKHLGINRKTLSDLRKRQPEVDEALAYGRAALEKELSDLLLDQARKGNTVAAIYLTKARCGWREGEVRDATPAVAVQINLPAARTEDDWRPPVIDVKEIEDATD